MDDEAFARRPAQMDLDRGFEIEVPSVFVPWGVSEAELLDLLPVVPRRITTGYYVMDCVSLSGLSHALGFHFRPRSSGALRELEFFRRRPVELSQSFKDFQEHLESSFGPPGAVSDGDIDGFPAYGWRIGVAHIRHYVFYRFGPEEHVRISRS